MLRDGTEPGLGFFKNAQFAHAVHAFFRSHFFDSLFRGGFEDYVFETRMLAHEERNNAVDRFLHLGRGEGLANGEVAVLPVKFNFRWSDVSEGFYL